MVEQITSFRTAAGKIFDTEFDAWCDEFREFLMTHGADNDAIARKIVKAVADGQPDTLDHLAGIVGNMERCAPPPAPIAAEPPVAIMGDITEKLEVPFGTPLFRCMGGKRCDHQPGTCTATAAVSAPDSVMHVEV